MSTIHKLLILVLIYLGQFGLQVVSREIKNSKCKFEVDIDSDYLPVIWDENGIIYPELTQEKGEKKWFLEMDHGKKFKSSCTSYQDSIRTSKTNEVECISEDSILMLGKVAKFETLKCEFPIEETVVRNGNCYNGYTNIDIQFETEDKVFNFISSCHNEETSETLYSKHILHGKFLDLGESVPNNPSFKEAGFYPNINTDNCYKQVEQNKTIAELTSPELAAHYIQPNKQLFLARGHLTPKGDGICAYEKRATYYFINVTPQWQTINGGNWERVESAIRQYAKDEESTLTIWTGSSGYSELLDENNNAVEIWLGRDLSSNELTRRLPIPHLTWKVIYDEEKNRGLALVTINNPWKDSVSTSDIICSDVCTKINWLNNIDLTDIVKGYTYCCSIEEFSNAIPYAPQFEGRVKLLK